MSVLKIWNGSSWVQIDTIKGEPFTFEDFTPEQLLSIKGDTGESAVHVGVDAPTDPDILVWVDTDAAYELDTQKWAAVDIVATQLPAGSLPTASISQNGTGTHIEVGLVDGAVGASIVSAAFNGDDIDFTKDDSSVVTLADAVSTFRGEPGCEAVSVVLPFSGWVAQAQTISVTDVTADNLIHISPTPTSEVAYATAGIYATAQGVGTLSFTCVNTPTVDINLVVVIYANS